MLAVVLATAPCLVAAAVQVRPAPAESAQVAAGRAVYEKARCVTCHQIDGRGNRRYPLDGVASRLTPEQIRRWLTHPAEMEASLPVLPALRMSTMQYRFSPRDLDALVAYLGTLR